MALRSAGPGRGGCEFIIRENGLGFCFHIVGSRPLVAFHITDFVDFFFSFVK